MILEDKYSIISYWSKSNCCNDKALQRMTNKNVIFFICDKCGKECMAGHLMANNQSNNLD